MVRILVCVLLLLVAFTLSACGGDSTAGGTVVDTDISIQTTDIESLSVGTEQQCIERLTKVVDVDYLQAHDVIVDDEPSAEVATEKAIAKICADADPETEVHEAAHVVIHAVVEELFK